MKNLIKVALAGAVSMALFGSGPTIAADDKDVAAAAALALGVGALVHHHHNHKEKKHRQEAKHEAEFERGYNDGLHHHGFDSYNDHQAYRDGYESGQYDRRHRNDHYRHDDAHMARHGAPNLAQRACVGEAAAHWGGRPTNIYPVKSRQLASDDFLVEVAHGYQHGKCEVSADGNVYLFENGVI